MKGPQGEYRMGKVVGMWREKQSVPWILHPEWDFSSGKGGIWALGRFLRIWIIGFGE